MDLTKGLPSLPGQALFGPAAQVSKRHGVTLTEVGDRHHDAFRSKIGKIMANPKRPIRSLLVLGGARSGKSRYAQKLAEASSLRPLLIATAKADDAEMGERIAHHAASRDARWTLVEEPVALAGVLCREARKDRIIVVDCATLWLSNVLSKNDNLDAATQELAQGVARLPGPVIFVSNETGCGIVPENALACTFRDAQGRLNQALAEACEAVVLVSAGIALCLKPAPEPNFRF